MNDVEKLLKNSSHLGLSIKQLKNTLKLSKNAVKFYIYNSKMIEDVNPLLHGSGKSKINVFKSCEPSDLNYYNRKRNMYIKKKKIKLETPVNTEIQLIA